MKFGMVLPTFYPAALNKLVLDAAEAVSADSVWVVDHLMGVFSRSVYSEIPISAIATDPDAILEPFCLCAWAGRTTAIPLGVAVTDAIRRSAADTARTALSLQHLCSGGFHLGVGAGEVENLTPYGYSVDRPVEKTERFLQTLRHILETGDMPEGPGRFGFPTSAGSGIPKVWIAGHRPRMLRLTGQYGDGWLPFQVETPDDYHHLKTLIAEHAAAAGRPEPESGLWVFTILGENRDQVKQLYESQPMAKLFALWSATASQWQKYGFSGHPSGLDCRGYLDFIPHVLDAATLRQLAPQIPFELLEEHVFVGSAQEVATRLRGFADAGCEHIMVYNLSGMAGGMTEALARGGEMAALAETVRAFRPSVLV